MENNCAAIADSLSKAASCSKINIFFFRESALDRQQASVSEFIQPRTKISDRRTTGPISSGISILVKTVERTLADMADEIRRDLVALKHINDCVCHGCRAAVIFSCLIAQR